MATKMLSHHIKDWTYHLLKSLLWKKLCIMPVIIILNQPALLQIQSS